MTKFPRHLAQQTALICGLLLLAPAALQAQTLVLAGILGSKALLIVDGGAPKSLAAGESYQGVQVVSTSANQAVVVRSGQRHTLTLGDGPIRLEDKSSNAAEAKGTRIALTAGSGGHFIANGSINGRSVQFLVDTGASLVSMSSAQAEQAGINFKAGQATQMHTANGISSGWRVKLDSVRIGDVEVLAVDAVVTPQPMPFLLLGNSFLSRFQMLRDGDQLTLSKRY